MKLTIAKTPKYNQSAYEIFDETEGDTLRYFLATMREDIVALFEAEVGEEWLDKFGAVSDKERFDMVEEMLYDGNATILDLDKYANRRNS